jgi:hypothetical protein
VTYLDVELNFFAATWAQDLGNSLSENGKEEKPQP